MNIQLRFIKRIYFNKNSLISIDNGKINRCAHYKNKIFFQTDQII